jgi:hypothetical protein
MLYIIMIFSMLTTPYPSFQPHLLSPRRGAIDWFSLGKRPISPLLDAGLSLGRRGRGWLMKI